MDIPVRFRKFSITQPGLRKNRYHFPWGKFYQRFRAGLFNWKSLPCDHFCFPPKKKCVTKNLRALPGCRFGPESSRQTLVSPIFRSGLVPSVADCFRKMFFEDKSATLVVLRWMDLFIRIPQVIPGFGST